MYARVNEYRVPTEKLQGFISAAESVLPLIHKEAGFRAALMLKGEGSPILVKVITVWETLEDLRASEKSMFLYRAISRVMQFAKGFPMMEESEVLVGDFAAPASKKTSGAKH